MIIDDILFYQFQALLGQKYGYRPFPPNIVATEFEDLFTGEVPFYYHFINQNTSYILLVLLITLKLQRHLRNRRINVFMDLD